MVSIYNKKTSLTDWRALFSLRDKPRPYTSERKFNHTYSNKMKTNSSLRTMDGEKKLTKNKTNHTLR